MAVVTSAQLTRYFDLYHAIDVTLTRDVSQVLGFLQDHVLLKLMGTQWACLLYSTSLDGAKIILNLKPEQMEKLRTGSNLVSLRYAFRIPEKTEPLTFFATGKIRGYNRYNSAANNDLYFMTIEFTQRPSDTMIELLGGFLEANVNAQKRKDVRVPVNESTVHKLGFTSCNTIVAVQGVDRKCLIRDLSFGGALILIPGVAKFLMGKSVILRLVLEDSAQVLQISGTFVRVESIPGRQDITQAALEFVEQSVPHSYKLKINDAIHLLKIPPASQG